MISYLAQVGQDHGVTAENSWDMKTFFDNATTWTQVVGGAFLGLIGIAGVVWGGFLLVRKLMSGQQNQDNWLKIVALLIVGGAMLFGGMSLLLNFAQGGGQTISDFGNAGG